MLALALLLAAVTGATDLPVAGERLLLRDQGSRRSAVAILRDAAVAAPFPQPTEAGLIVAGGAAAGQCHVEVPLDAELWRPIRGNGALNGWIYRGPRRGGVERIVVRPGLLAVRARGVEGPCGLDAAQRLPLRLEIRFADRRYCASFGTARLNRAGALVAGASPRPSSCAKTDLTAATLNVLHGSVGAGCAQTARCRLQDRIDLLFNWIRARGCPDVVTLQEVSSAVADLVVERAPSACPFPYEVAYRRLTTLDDAIVLSRYPIVAATTTPLLRGFRHVLRATIDHPLGPVEVFTTHLASSGDGGPNPCDPGCPAPCTAAGAATVRECQAVQTAELIAATTPRSTPALLTGDFNEEPGSFAYEQFVARGWSDVFLDAGNGECMPGSGLACTSGRQDQNLGDLESRLLNLDERIDFIFMVPPVAPSLCTPRLDSPEDEDGDGTGTRLFAADPNPFAPECGPAPRAICWTSDHNGVEVDIECGDPGGG
jgi:endonuclease/exonuclease/phosphatase family metal-dependent hydrolase